jgi:hypothetical protein
MADLTDVELEALSRAVARQRAAEAALEEGYTPRRLAEAAQAKAQAEAMSAALLPSLLSEIAELRRLVRLHAPESLP